MVGVVVVVVWWWWLRWWWWWCGGGGGGGCGCGGCSRGGIGNNDPTIEGNNISTSLFYDGDWAQWIREN